MRRCVQGYRNGVKGYRKIVDGFWNNTASVSYLWGMNKLRELCEKLPRGRGLDALVSEYVMGEPVVDMRWPCGYDCESGNLEACWEKPAPKDSRWQYKHHWPVTEHDGMKIPVREFTAEPIAAEQVIDRLCELGWRVVRRQWHSDGKHCHSISAEYGVADKPPYAMVHRRGRDPYRAIAEAALWAMVYTHEGDGPS